MGEEEEEGEEEEREWTMAAAAETEAVLARVRSCDEWCSIIVGVVVGGVVTSGRVKVDR